MYSGISNEVNVPMLGFAAISGLGIALSGLGFIFIHRRDAVVKKPV